MIVKDVQQNVTAYQVMQAAAVPTPKCADSASQTS